MDLVDLNGMAPTAGVTSELVGMYTEAEEMDDSDTVHTLSDMYSNGSNLKSAGEIGKNTIDWSVQCATNKNLQGTLKTSQTAEEMAALEGISVGRYRRVTKARIKNGEAVMETIGDIAKSTSKFGGADILGIGMMLELEYTIIINQGHLQRNMRVMLLWMLQCLRGRLWHQQLRQ